MVDDLKALYGARRDEPGVCFVRPGSERPEYWRVAVFLWGDGVDIDSDGNSRTPDDRHWTELTVTLRPECEERVDVDPLDVDGAVLCIRGSRPELAARASWYLATETSGAVATDEAGPFLDPASLEELLGAFDAPAALKLARESRGG